MADNDIEVKIGADSAGVKAGMDGASNAVKDAMNQMNTSMASSVAIGTALGGIIGEVLVSAIRNLGASITESIAKTAEFRNEAENLGRKLGVTATEANNITTALDDIYVSTDEYTAAAKGMEKQLNKNEDALKKLGIATRDEHGNLRPLNDLMLDGIKTVNEYKEGTDRNITSTQIFGKAIEDGSRLLDITREKMEAATETNSKYGTTVGIEAVDDLDKFKAAQNEAGNALDGFKNVIGNALMPVVTELSTWFSDIAPAAIVVLKGAVGGLVAIFWGLKMSAEIVWNSIAMSIEVVTGQVLRFGGVFNAAMRGDWAGIKREWDTGSEFVQDSINKRLKNISDAADDTQEKLRRLFDDQTVMEPKGEATGKNAHLKGDDKKPKKEESIIPQLKAELDKQIEMKVGFFKESTQFEIDYWAKAIELTKEGSKDRATIESTVHNLKKKLAHEALSDELETIKLQMAAQNQAGDERVRLAQIVAEKMSEKYGAGSREHIKALRDVNAEEVALQKQSLTRAQQMADLERDLALGGIELERQSVEQKLALGATTATKELEALKALEEKKYQIELKAAYAKAALIKDDVVAYEAALNKIALDEQKHNTQMAAIDNKMALEKRKVFQGVADGIGSAFTRAFSGIIKGTMTLGEAMKSIFTGIFDAVLGALMNFVGQWIAQQIMMKVFGATMAKGSIMESAAVAGAAGTASFAAAPWPIDMGAPAFGASMAAAAGAYAGFSAEGGFDIPAGINPLVQTHQKEMILPAEHADTIRNLKGGSGGMTVNISAVDAGSIKRLFMQHGSAIADSLQSQRRNFKVTK